MTDSGIGIYSEKLGVESQSGLDILSKYKEAKLFSRGKYIPIRPLQALTDEGPYQFEVGSHTTTDVFMLKSLRLTVKLKIVKSDGTNLGADENV